MLVLGQTNTASHLLSDSRVEKEECKVLYDGRPVGIADDRRSDLHDTDTQWPATRNATSFKAKGPAAVSLAARLQANLWQSNPELCL